MRRAAVWECFMDEVGIATDFEEKKRIFVSQLPPVPGTGLPASYFAKAAFFTS